MHLSTPGDNAIHANESNNAPLLAQAWRYTVQGLEVYRSTLIHYHKLWRDGLTKTSGPQTSSSSLDTKAPSVYSLLGHSLRAHRTFCHATMSKGILVYLTAAEEFGFNVITTKPNAL